MTPEKQRIAIAEACGWVKHEPYSDSWHKNSGHQYSAPVGTSAFLGRHALPDYLRDLNAMHEAEKVLMDSTDKKRNYLEWLGWEDDYMASAIAICAATAAQRAEAFLRTIGKWEEAQ